MLLVEFENFKRGKRLAIVGTPRLAIVRDRSQASTSTYCLPIFEQQTEVDRPSDLEIRQKGV